MQETTTPLAESLRIVLAGITNAGKSSLLNALFQKDIAVVSDQHGTTTDPVTRKIELGALGACSVTDTAGLDDEGELAAARIAKSRERILTADLVLFVSPCDRPIAPCERELLSLLRERNTPFLAVLSFADRADENITAEKEALFADAPCVWVCANSADGIEALLRAIESRATLLDRELTPVEGIVRAGDTVLLVTPIDSAAPKGRLILPQVETLRDLLDHDCNAIVVKESGLNKALDSLKNPPDLVITDSQAFKQVAAILPSRVPLTSFSILFARKKGGIDYFLQSLAVLEHFPPNGTVLIMEACSHHRKEDDIGTVKIPAIFKKRFGDGVRFAWSRELPAEIAAGAQKPDLVIHCGACMITRNAMTERVAALKAAGIPVLNYGLFLAWANGLFPRAIEVLKKDTL